MICWVSGFQGFTGLGGVCFWEWGGGSCAFGLIGFWWTDLGWWETERNWIENFKKWEGEGLDGFILVGLLRFVMTLFGHNINQII
jgi:hypothetical protein